MLSRPAYDPNLLTGRVTPAQLEAMSKDPFQPLIFRATQQQYPPGSTFKPIAMLAGLRSGEFTAKTTFRCTGGYRLGNRTWRCFNERGHGLIDVKSAIRESCDAFFYHLGDVVGLEALYRTASELGLGKPTGIGVVAEVPGIMPSEEYYAHVPGGYQQYMALNSAVGQGDDSMTPLQMLVAYSAIANGGTVFQPQVVKRIETVDGQVVQEFAPKVVRHVDIDPEQRQVLIDGMTAVVNEPGGTAYWTRLKDIKMAGKTGTAQVRKLGAVRLKKEQIGYWERDNAWFIGFAPAEDPEIAVVTLSEHAGFGGSESAPVVAAVIQKYFDLKRDTLEVEASPIEPPEIRPRPPVFKAPPPPPDAKEPTAPNPDVPDEAVLPSADEQQVAKPDEPAAKPEEPAKKEEPVTTTAPAGVH
jgi:penicillin-binding protein 2